MMLQTLIGLGLTELDAKIYIFLASHGPQNAKEIAKGLELNKQKVYRILRELGNEGLIEVYYKRPTLFSSLPFEKVLELFLEIKIEEEKTLKATKKELFSSWRSIAEKDKEKS